MPLILLLNAYVDPSSGQLNGTHWPLPPGTEAEDIRRRLIEGMASGSAIEVRVVLPDTDRLEASLLLNGSLLASAVIVRVGDEADGAAAAAQADAPDAAT